MDLAARDDFSFVTLPAYSPGRVLTASRPVYGRSLRGYVGRSGGSVVMTRTTNTVAASDSAASMNQLAR